MCRLVQAGAGHVQAGAGWCRSCAGQVQVMCRLVQVMCRLVQAGYSFAEFKKWYTVYRTLYSLAAAEIELAPHSHSSHFNFASLRQDSSTKQWSTSSVQSSLKKAFFFSCAELFLAWRGWHRMTVTRFFRVQATGRVDEGSSSPFITSAQPDGRVRVMCASRPDFCVEIMVASMVSLLRAHHADTRLTVHDDDEIVVCRLDSVLCPAFWMDITISLA